MKARRAALKQNAREWEREFEQSHGNRPSIADRKASAQYLSIRRSLKHADAALRIMEENGEEAVLEAVRLHKLQVKCSGTAEKFLRAAYGAGELLPADTVAPPRLNGGGGEGAFEARLEEREGNGNNLAHAPSGKLLVQPGGTYGSNFTPMGPTSVSFDERLLRTAPIEQKNMNTLLRKPSAEKGIGAGEEGGADETASGGKAGSAGGDAGDQYAGKREFEPVTPGCFTRTFVKRPCLIALCVMFAALGVSFLAVNPRGGGMPELVQRGGWSSDTSSVVLTLRATRAVSEDAVSLSSAEQAAEAAADEPERKPLVDTIAQTMVVYNAHAGASVFTAGGVAAMAGFERRVLELPEYDTTYCKRVYSRVNPEEHACEGPMSLLSVLHLNATRHAEQCVAGFCNAPSSMMSMCGAAVAWGVPPCTSKVFDWRHGTLADEADWPALLKERLCGPIPFMRRLILEAEQTCTDASVDLAALQYARAFVPMGWPLLNFTGEDKIGNDTDWTAQWSVLTSSPFASNLKLSLKGAQDEFSATTSSARSYATEGAEGKPLSITWMNDATMALNDVSQA